MTGGSPEPFADRMDAALRRQWAGEAGAFDGVLAPAGSADPLAALGAETAADGPSLVPGARLGSCRIVRRIGRGGMGIVYEAEQEATRRRVAVKVLRPSGGSRAAQALLLRREATALARLRHPGIATMYDAAFDGGTCFVVMELVRGRRIDEHCDGAGLGTRERVGLLVALCDAVVYAHERGVIHRDLKPANVLVEDDGRVRVLDFGLARLLRDGDEETLPTLGASMPGTPEYMSPEQVEGAGGAVDVRTDVYSLGVLAYEVLLGRLPYPVPRESPLAAARAIAEAEPARPRRVDPSFPRDLEAIVLTALEKDAGQRYANARELADDLRRYLADRPVEAREPTLGYALAKLARRRKGLVAAAAVSTLAVAAGVVALNVGLVRARAAEAVAREEANVARTVSRFQAHLFSSANPDLADRPGMTVRELLDRTSPEVGTWFADSARAEAEVRTILGRAYNAMGAFDEALPHLERAAALRRAEGEPIATARALRNLAFLLHGMERFEEAETLHAEALASRRAHRGDRHEETVQSRVELAALLRDTGRLDEAIGHLRAAFEACAAPGPRPAEQLADALFDWSTCEVLRGRREAALEPLIDAWALVGGDDDAPLDDRVTVRCRRATILRHLGRDAESREELDDALALARGAGALDDRGRIAVHVELGETLVRHDRAAEAVSHLETATRLRDERFGARHALSLRLACRLGDALSRAGHAARAEERLREALRGQEEVLGADGPDAFRTRFTLGEHLARHGDRREARRLFASCLAPGGSHPSAPHLAVRAATRIGMTHLRDGAPGEARAAFEQALDLVAPAQDADGNQRAVIDAWAEWAALLEDRPGPPPALPETIEDLEAAIREARPAIQVGS